MLSVYFSEARDAVVVDAGSRRHRGLRWVVFKFFLFVAAEWTVYLPS